MRALAAALLLVALLAPAAAQRAPDDPTVLVYHVAPDPEAGRPDADPFSASGVMPEGVDPTRLPTTRADGVLLADAAPEGNPDSAVAHFRELQRLISLRAASGAPVTLDLDGTLTPGNITVRLVATPTVAMGRARLHLVLAEDGVPFDDGGGTRALRYVARAVADPVAVDLSSPANATWTLPLAQSGRLVVVAFVTLSEDAGTHVAGEVLQSASWSPRQAGATHQVAKSALIEHVSATWCQPCQPSDDAIDLLAARSGDSTIASGATYARAPSVLALVGLAAGAVAAVALFRRRAA